MLQILVLAFFLFCSGLSAQAGKIRIDNGTQGTLPVNRGGTGSTTASGARSNLGVPSTTAGGDLSGTLPSPAVIKVNGVAYPTSPSTNTVPVVTGSNTITYEGVPNAALAYSATTVNGQTCTLGSTCTITAAASPHDLLSLTHGDTAAHAANLGDTIYGGVIGFASLTPIYGWVALSGNLSATRKFYNQTGTGSDSAPPEWDALLSGDIPDLSATYSTKTAGGDLSGTLPNPSVATVGGSSAANVHSAELAANAATNANTASTIVKRDGSGNFSGGTFTGNVTGNASGTAANITGVAAVANGGTGLSTAPAHTLWLPAAGCNNATAAGAYDLPTSNAPSPNCKGTSYRYGVLDYDDSANETATFNFKIPAGWTGSVDADLRWAVNGTSQAAKWTIATVCVATGADILNPTFNAAQTISTTSGGTANFLTSSTQSAVTMTGCSAGNDLIVKVGRDTTDTSTLTLSLIGVELTLRITPQS